MITTRTACPSSTLPAPPSRRPATFVHCLSSVLLSATILTGIASASNEVDLRLMGDVNGDGCWDQLMVFRESGIITLMGRADGLSGSVGAFPEYAKHLTRPAGWEPWGKHPLVVGDVTGDGRADLVGFGGADVFLANAQPNGSFTLPEVALEHTFSVSNGWDHKVHVRTLADVNGDGRDDIVGFGGNDVFVSLSDGSSFGPQESYLRGILCDSAGWKGQTNLRRLGDVDGDGDEDIVAFGGPHTLVALSQSGRFEAPEAWTNYFSSGNGWQTSLHERRLADVNGDGLADIVGFGGSRVFVSLSLGGSFANAIPVHDDFGTQQGFGTKDLRDVVDVNGDGYVDLVVVRSDGTYRVALGNGDATFSPSHDWEQKPVSLFAETYTTPRTVKPTGREYGVNEEDHELSTTLTYASRDLTASPVGTDESVSHGGEEQMLRTVSVDHVTEMARGQKATTFVLTLTPMITRRNGETLITLIDNSSFRNECYEKKDHSVGFFLDEVKIRMDSSTTGWQTPSFGPQAANQDAGYSHNETMGISLDGGFAGKAPSGSAGFNWSQSSSSSASVPDLSFTARTVEGAPELHWWTTNMYDTPQEPVGYNEPWDAVRKVALQVDLSRSTYDAPNLAQGTFDSLAYATWRDQLRGGAQTSGQEDFLINIEYEVTYRFVSTELQSEDDFENFWRGFGLVFGANPDMYSGEAFRKWSTVKVTHVVPVTLRIPKYLLQPMS